jgi:magnesium-protoporphyrin O-methyltransferase
VPYNCCEITDKAFSEAEARAELRNYRRRGAMKQTKLILEAIRSLRIRAADLIDVGGGIGVIHHELLDDVASKATHVDASSAYLKAAKEEAARRGHGERVHFIHADFMDVATDISQADIVTLDRVVCCYPDFRGLLKAGAEHSRRAVVLHGTRGFFSGLWISFRTFVKTYSACFSILLRKWILSSKTKASSA